ncbi:Polynucleotidyl transferase- ribonuclease H-like superfamily protein [Striga hermonthica]|uniref:RNA exonuclease 4 n=1 Tax=Striga hermonthica TaxID=68872 RepID=A0A9N7MVC0_STRHE|nr:Polynucleotidyl transferase- ribonuclease H-like superfamily protein [Striga hermonthica]
MAGKLKNPSKNLNPNWAQLQEKLKINGGKNHFSKGSSKPDKDIERSILGKRKERTEEDSQAPKPNPLIPTSSDCSLTDEVAMDCEMVGVSSSGNKSALGRVTLVNKWGNVLYDEYVRPVDYVVDFRTEISGIRPRDLRKAKNFNVVQKTVAEMIHGRILVGHALRNDLKALLLSHPKKDIRDTSEYAPFLKDGRSRSLKNLAAQFLNVEIQNGEHCPIEDARAAMVLYQKSRKQWERSVKDFGRLKEKQKKRKHKKKQNREGSNGTGSIPSS